MEMIALYTRLRAGMEDHYEAFHKEVPAEIADDLIARGVRDWCIWRRDRDLFHLVIAEDYDRFRNSTPTNEIAGGWGEVMAPFLEINNEFGESNAMRSVWSLHEQLAQRLTEEHIAEHGIGADR
jgi:L-rhamnose mutarotase